MVACKSPADSLVVARPATGRRPTATAVILMSALLLRTTGAVVGASAG